MLSTGIHEIFKILASPMNPHLSYLLDLGPALPDERATLGALDY